MKTSTIILVLLFASSGAQAQTALEKPFVLASRFSEHTLRLTHRAALRRRSSLAQGRGRLRLD